MLVIVKGFLDRIDNSVIVDTFKQLTPWQVWVTISDGQWTDWFKLKHSFNQLITSHFIGL